MSSCVVYFIVVDISCYAKTWLSFNFRATVFLQSMSLGLLASVTSHQMSSTRPSTSTSPQQRMSVAGQSV